jgi:hypothetical protein
VADTFTVVFDACVLYPFALRDVLVQLATTDLFRGRRSRDIHDEWMAAVLDQNPHITRGRLERTRQLMDEHVLDAVVTGYEPLISGITLPDPKDRHVVAAAIRCGAQVIVTKNLRDFPESALGPLGIEAQHPDEFVCCLLDLGAELVCRSVRTCRSYLTSPAMTVEDYLRMLARQDLPATVGELRKHASKL